MTRIIKYYRTVNGQCPVEEYLEALDDRRLAKVLAVFELIETFEIVPSKYFKKLSGYDLWECRVEFAGQAFRFLGFWDKQAIVILTHGFTKKTQKTPSQEIRRALENKSDWQRRTR